MSEYSDSIDKLPKDNIPHDEKSIQLCNLFLGIDNHSSSFGWWKSLILIFVIVACLLPIKQLSKYNQTYVGIAKILIVLITTFILFYVL